MFRVLNGLFLLLGVMLAFILIVLSDGPRQNQGRGLVDRKLVKAPLPVTLLLDVPRRLFCFGSLVISGVPLFIVILVINKY